MSERFIIEGGKPLKGTIQVKGSKNSTTPIIAATLLTDKPCVISNVPLIEDVFRMLELIQSLGAEVVWLSKDRVKIQAKNIDPSKIDASLVSRMRSSILIMGPLLARFNFVEMNHPGGCIIGNRTADTHLRAFAQLGAEVKIKYVQSRKKKNENKCSEKTAVYSLKNKKDKENNTIILDEFSVTATENILMACALSERKTTIKIAACEPHIQELAEFLRKMGVSIKGEGTHTIEIKGAKKLKGADHFVSYDYVEAGTYILMGLTVGGELIVDNVPTEHLELFINKLKLSKGNVDVLTKRKVLVKTSPKMKIDKIQTLTHPGIATDLQSAFGVLATQTDGPTLIHDPLYDGRLKYLEEINKMGAKIVVCDPHRAIIDGKTKLYGTDLGPLDLRGGAALIMAGLAAKGTTIISNVAQVDRGYERIEERLEKLGASIKRIKS